MNKIDAIYARYSSHAQDDGTSIDVQLEQCERAAAGKCSHYIDRAKTGRSMGGREQLLKLLADADAGKIGRVFVYKFDRLGRSGETHVIAQQLDDAGVELISATEGTNALARGIQLVVAEDYSRQLAMRTRDGLLKRFEQAGWTGGPTPYGYRSIERGSVKALEIDADEAEIVRDMVHLYLCEGKGFKGIARRLRERGILTRKGNPFCFTSIRAVLVNPILTGRVRYNVRKMQLDRRTGRRVPRWKESGEVKERTDDTLRIVDDETFAAVQARLKAAARGQTVRATWGIAPLSGMVYCTCGAKCHRSKSKNAKGEYYYYRCDRRARYGDCGNMATLREDKIIVRIQTALAVVLDQSDAIVSQATELALAEVKSNRTESERLRRELQTIDAKLSRLVDQTTDPATTKPVRDVLHREIGKQETRRNEIQASLEGLHDDANDVGEQLAEIVRQKFAEAKRMLSGAMTPEDFNRIVQMLVGPMELASDGHVGQKQLPPAMAGGSVQGFIAGGGFEPPTSGL